MTTQLCNCKTLSLSLIISACMYYSTLAAVMSTSLSSYNWCPLKPKLDVLASVFFIFTHLCKFSFTNAGCVLNRNIHTPSRAQLSRKRGFSLNECFNTTCTGKARFENNNGELFTEIIWNTLKAVSRGKIISNCANKKKKRLAKLINLTKELKGLEMNQKR